MTFFQEPLNTLEYQLLISLEDAISIQLAQNTGLIPAHLPAADMAFAIPFTFPPERYQNSDESTKK